jgi:hypothetical protein
MQCKSGLAIQKYQLQDFWDSWNSATILGTDIHRVQKKKENIVPKLLLLWSPQNILFPIIA